MSPFSAHVRHILADESCWLGVALLLARIG
jgi:hypothetical protein